MNLTIKKRIESINRMRLLCPHCGDLFATGLHMDECAEEYKNLRIATRAALTTLAAYKSMESEQRRLFDESSV